MLKLPWSKIIYVKAMLTLTYLISQSTVAASPLVVDSLKLELVAEGFVFTEGPAALPNGDVIFSDIHDEKLHKWHALTNKVEQVRDNTQRTNGLYFNKEGHLYACQWSGKKLIKITDLDDVDSDVVITSSFKNKPYNQPNDLWISGNGSLYFTDPNYGKKKLTQDGEHVYFVDTNNQVSRVKDSFIRPNGIIGHIDNKTLYITDPGAGKTYRYHITNNGELENKTLVINKGGDGMTLDEDGRLYLTIPKERALVVIDANNELVGIKDLGVKATNVTFAGVDGKTLFVTAQKQVFKIDMPVKGMYTQVHQVTHH